MHKIYIHRNDLVATQLNIQYHDEPPLRLDLTIEMLEATKPGYAIVPWVWAADDSPFRGERLKVSKWHLPLRVERQQIPDVISAADISIDFIHIDSIQVLEVMEDGSILIRTYSSVDNQWEVIDEVEVVLEF